MFLGLVLQGAGQDSNDTIYYDSGEIERIIAFSDSMEYAYYLNGNLRSQRRLKETKIGTLTIDWHHMDSKKFYEYGTLKMENTQSGDTAIEKWYHSNGQELSVTKVIARFGKESYRESWLYCENGQLEVHYPMPIGGKHQMYHCNGQLALEADSTTGYVPQGYTINYYEDGTIWMEGLCLPVPNSPACTEHGVWKYYDKTGKLIKEITFEYAREISRKEY